MNSLLKVSGLSVQFPGERGSLLPVASRRHLVDVVCDVSFELAHGETLAVVGESGSGKTTLAMALAGLAPISAGQVCFDGVTLRRNRRHCLLPDRRRCALLFQDAVGSLSPRMSVAALVAEPLLLHRAQIPNARAEVERLLSVVGLGVDFLNRYPHELSGGQARRVGVARALASRPELLIADEPTAGLDVSVQGGILNLLAELQREMGLAILVITHNLSVVRHVAHQTAVMYLGRFVELGHTGRIFSQPLHPYTAALLSANPSSDLELVRNRIELAGEAPGLLSRPPGCEFHPRCPGAQPLCSERFPARTRAGEGDYVHCHFPAG